jgi:hypothetical protein
MSMAKHWSARNPSSFVVVVVKGYQLFAKAQRIDRETSILIPCRSGRLLHTAEFLIVAVIMDEQF